MGRDSEAESNPLATKQFGLGQRRFHRIVLKVRRIAVFVENALHHHPDFGARAFAKRPIDAGAFFDLADQLRCDQFGLCIATWASCSKRG